KPNRSVEEVLASQTSGLKGTALPFSPTDLQDLSLYKNWVQVLGKSYPSPLHDNSIDKYQFELTETFVSEEDTIFTIRFQPASAFPGFYGEMKIQTPNYAISSFQASVDLPQDLNILQSIRINQIHQFIPEKKIWFPKQLRAEIQIDPQSTFYLGMEVRSDLRDIEIGKPHSSVEFGVVELKISPDAAQKSNEYWETVRPDTLSSKEKNTYYVMDSLGKRIKLAQLMTQTQKLSQGKIGISLFDLDLKRLYLYNEVEKHRIGIGLQTNEKISKRYSIGGWYGYGFQDKQSKYGGFVQVFPFADKRFQLHVGYESNLIESGNKPFQTNLNQQLYERTDFSFNVRSLNLRIMDYNKRIYASLFFPSLRGLSHRIGWQQEQIIPAFEYAWTNQSTTESVSQFQFQEWIIESRFAPKEKFFADGVRY
ncbi:MAG: DUF5686 family protein, partial [Bacteroidia bacterium]|nr:DUF5686 family protein [Bacteroidia bacterium]